MLTIMMFTSALNKTNNKINHMIVNLKAVRKRGPIPKIERMDGNDKDNGFWHLVPIDYYYYYSFLLVGQDIE